MTSNEKKTIAQILAEKKPVPKQSQIKSPSLLKIKTVKNNVLAQPINKLSRDLATQIIANAYLRLSNLDTNENIFWELKGPSKDVPEQLAATVKDVESQLYKEYGKNPKEYLKQIAKLNIFLNPEHYIGQFAKMFRLKTLQGVYTPDRLLQLDVTDMLPEVFLNPKAQPAAKLDIYQSINQMLSDKIQELILTFNQVLNPTATIPTFGKGMQITYVDKMIAKNQTNVNDLCENPFWKMKKVNMIICKEDNKFYCLDLENLLIELAEKNTATNYFTKKTLPPEIINNIRSRYSSEIAEIQKTGDPVTIGRRTESEVDDLKTTLAKLKNFKKVFNQPSVLESMNLFGFDLVEDPSVGGVENILNDIPPMIQKEINGYFETDNFDTVIENVNLWLDSNIDEINKVISNFDTEKSTELQDKGMVDIASDSDVVIEASTPKIPQDTPFQTLKAEEQLIKDEILKDDTISAVVYNDYITRLTNISGAIVEDLKSISEMGVRQELNAQLSQVNEELRKLRNKGRSIKGIISLLDTAQNAATFSLAQLNNAIGMNVFYPEDLPTAQAERDTLEKWIGDLQAERAFLEELYQNFKSKQ